jgi:hypothetical protein
MISPPPNTAWMSPPRWRSDAWKKFRNIRGKMIKLTSSYPLQSFLRITQEFHEDKIIVRKKSLTAEVEFDIDYNQIADIRFISQASGDLTFTGFMLIGLLSIFSVFFYKALYGNLVLLTIVQFLLPIAAFLYFMGFIIKRLYCQILDHQGNFITGIKLDRANADDIYAAIELIKQKSNRTIEELDISEPFPETKSIHELIEYDIPDFISKSTIRLYETELIDYEKSLVLETVKKVKYCDVHQFAHGKIGNNQWGTISLHLLMLASGFVASRCIYAFPQALSQVIRQSTVPLILAFSLPMLLMFVKEDVIYLLNNKNLTLNYVKFNKSNKKKVKQILEFISSNSPAKANGSFDSIKPLLD